MKRLLPIMVALLLPAALFAQGRMLDESSMLKGFGLNDAQISQVQTIESTTRAAVRADLTHIRLVQAQVAEALLPSASGPDASAINALLDKKGQFRTDIDKNLMSARLQLTKIMGNDNYAKYAAFVRAKLRNRIRPEGMLPGAGARRPPAPQGPAAANP